MYRVGLTGGIATGKSRVLSRLAECGLHTIDLDAVAHRVIEPGHPAHAEILAAFGDSVRAAEGAIDRRALGAIVFSDASARARLNAIVHPRVYEEEQRLVAALDPKVSPVVVTDATLLVETGHHLRFSRLLATYCDRRQQIARIMHRDGLSAGAAQARLAAQMPAEEKARFAHEVIETNGATADTDARARALATDLCGRAEAWAGPAPLSIAQACGGLARGPDDGPRGLAPRRLAETIADAGWPPLPALAAGLHPPASGAWHEAGRIEGPGAGPETLMGPVVLWSMAWHGADIEALVAAAVSVARLTHHRPEALAAAASMALALFEAAQAGVVAGDLAARVASRTPLVERWTGHVPPPALLSMFTRAAAADPGDNGLEGALHGIARGIEPEAASPAVRASARRLSRG